MAKVAVVTGGTRGIGHAISIALKQKGFRVAANYAGNDQAAQKFQAETGIPVYKWDVGDYEACASGLQRVEADLGPISVVVNNAGITRDGMFHKMTFEQWSAVLRTNLFRMRDAIDQYYADKGKYPSSLDALVSEGYMRSIPEDPITKSRSVHGIACATAVHPISTTLAASRLATCSMGLRTRSATTLDSRPVTQGNKNAVPRGMSVNPSARAG